MEEINTEQKIADIFSIFHDGNTSTWEINEELFTLKINCQYLAEKIDKSYQSFFVEFTEIRNIEFIPWMSPIELEQIKIYNLDKIFETELEILSAEIENGNAKIIFNQHNRELHYCGGNLVINSKEIKIFNEIKKELSIDELYKLCSEYWNDVKLETEKQILNRNEIE